MATIKDKIGLAMIPSVYDGGISTSTTDFSGTVHSLLPIQHESPNLVVPDFVTGWTLVNGSVSNNVYSASLTAYQSGIKVTPPWIENYTIKVTFDLILNSGSLRVDDGLSGVVNTFNTSGSKEIIFYGFNKLEFNAYNLGFDGEISNIKIVRISNGDFDFERSSAATRVGPDGYIKDVQVIGEELVQNGNFEEIGSELVTNGGFDTDTNWTHRTSSSVISNGVLSWDGTQVADDDIFQEKQGYIGKLVEMTITISSYTQGSVFLRTGSTQTPTSRSSAGTFTEILEWTGNDYIYVKATSDFIGSIDNVSVKEVGQNWTFGTGWSIEDDGGNLKGIHDNSGGATVLEYSNITVTSGKKYRLSYSATNLSGGYIRADLGGVTGILNFSSGDYTYDIEATSSAVLYFVTSANLNLDNVSVKEVTDDTDIPRLDYSDGACPTLLLEPQRINKVLQSQNFTNTYWNDGANVSYTNNQDTSPDGQNNATKLVANATSNKHWFERLSYGDGASETNYVYSAFFKSSGSDFIQIATSTGFSSKYQNFNLKSGILANGDLNSAGYSASIEHYKDGWYRCIVKATTDVGSTSARFIIVPILANVGRNALFTGDGVNGVLTYGHQLEEGSYPTSYIPTNGSAVTRLADVCNNAGDSTIFNNEEGVLFVDMALLENDGNNAISISDGTNSNRIFISYNALGRLDVNVLSGNTYQAIFNYTGVANTKAFNKIALKYKENDFALWVNGVEVVTDSSGITPLGLDRLNFAPASVITDNFFGKTRSLLYFNEALTDAELEALTSSTATQVLNNYSTLLTRVGATYESSGLETKLNELL